MAFQKGQPRPPNAGRKPGSVNKKRIPKVADYLAEKNINPVDEILALIPELKPWEQPKVWLELLSYCEAKPKAIEVLPSTDEDLDDFEDVSNEDLLRLIKSPDGAA